MPSKYSQGSHHARGWWSLLFSWHNSSPTVESFFFLRTVILCFIFPCFKSQRTIWRGSFKSFASNLLSSLCRTEAGNVCVAQHKMFHCWKLYFFILGTKRNKMFLNRQHQRFSFLFFSFWSMFGVLFLQFDWLCILSLKQHFSSLPEKCGKLFQISADFQSAIVCGSGGSKNMLLRLCVVNHGLPACDLVCIRNKIDSYFIRPLRIQGEKGNLLSPTQYLIHPLLEEYLNHVELC